MCYQEKLHLNITVIITNNQILRETQFSIIVKILIIDHHLPCPKHVK